MIASIEGHLRAVGRGFVVVQVGGLGIRVYVPESYAARCGPIGSTIALHTHLHVREEELTLYGCQSEDDLQLFELLLGVSGVGPKVGLSVLSALTADEIRGAIATEQSAILSSVPGIGAKTAKKIIFDLKDKVQAPSGIPTPVPQISEADSEVIAALTALGYSVVEAQSALQHVPPELTLIEERLRAALAYLGS
ncbi:MAG: Holliday junction branch migration protein RuvA [Anaerolineae bacterium]|nr:Holliday junction branch migration protein RuvA [Anaerolineae bacterium]